MNYKISIDVFEKYSVARMAAKAKCIYDGQHCRPEYNRPECHECIEDDIEGAKGGD